MSMIFTTLLVVFFLSTCAFVLYILFRTFILFPNAIFESGFKKAFKSHIFSIIWSILLISPYFYFKHRQESEWLEALPPELKVSSSVLIHESFDFREGCAVGIFKLPDSTLSSISSKGVSFFDHATKPSNSRTKGWEYEKWSKIGGSNYEYHNKRVQLINCHRELSRKTISDLETAVNTGIGYVTYAKGTALVVLPSLGYAILSYDNG